MQLDPFDPETAFVEPRYLVKAEITSPIRRHPTRRRATSRRGPRIVSSDITTQII